MIEEFLLSMLPCPVRSDVADERDKIRKEIENKKVKKREEQILLLCKDKEPLDLKEHSMINQTVIILLELSDKEIQRLLRDTDSQELAVGMKVLPGKARAKIFRNLSKRLGELIAEDMEYMGPVRRKDGESACAKMMKRVIALEHRAEICPHDFSLLQLILDMYDSAEKENKELREKYRDLYRMLEQIYWG